MNVVLNYSALGSFRLVLLLLLHHKTVKFSPLVQLIKLLFVSQFFKISFFQVHWIKTLFDSLFVFLLGIPHQLNLLFLFLLFLSKSAFISKEPLELQHCLSFIKIVFFRLFDRLFQFGKTLPFHIFNEGVGFCEKAFVEGA